MRLIQQLSVVSVAPITLGLLVTGCNPYRSPEIAISSEPVVQAARVLPLAVKDGAWSAILKTLVLEGEVIESIQSPLSRVTFHKALNESDFREICDTSTIKSIDPDSWQYKVGAIDVQIWLDERQGDAKGTQLKMEGRCDATYDVPKARQYLLAPLFLSLPAVILTGGKAFAPQSVVIRSTGKLERDLQEKIIRTLGTDLPP